MKINYFTNIINAKVRIDKFTHPLQINIIAESNLSLGSTLDTFIFIILVMNYAKGHYKGKKTG